MSQSRNDRTRTTEMNGSDRHRVLAADRRRVALDILSNRTTPVAVDELAEAIAAHDDGGPPQSEHVDRIAVTLHHEHLPLMTDAGAIRYEPTSRRVEAVDVTTDLP